MKSPITNEHRIEVQNNWKSIPLNILLRLN